jgi:hypothetical protein
MLAQEEAVICRGPGARKGVEAAFGLGGETEGTLVLTDQRLVYVHGDEKEVDLRIGAFSQKHLFFADVTDLDSMKLDSESLAIPIAKLTSVKGHGGPAIAPKLEVKWTDQKGESRGAEFVQQVVGSSRRTNLNDWAKVIEKLKTKRLKIVPLPPAPASGTLEGRILGVLGDMQEKGPLTVEQEVEERFGVDLDPDEVEAACETLVKSGLAKKIVVRGEDTYYRRVSPIPEDDMGG